MYSQSGRQLAVFTKLNAVSPYDPAMALEVFAQMSGKRMSTQKPAQECSSSFIHNCKNFETTNMSFSKEMGKHTRIHPYKEMSFDNNKLSSTSNHEKPQRTLRCVLLGQSACKCHSCKISATRHAAKGKTVGMIHDPPGQGLGGGKRETGEPPGTQGFQGGEVILQDTVMVAAGHDAATKTSRTAPRPHGHPAGTLGLVHRDASIVLDPVPRAHAGR